ncbi:rhamnogalacturonan acetylesterase [Mucilaginibacter terrae]|uniref:Lysophospholipase L1-like esterase n=1 Tax=Mucilaginibacter terrae TaxID=1955052 RepID=A0ABU3GXM2_9SPHI|nr:rhamnogalacturonan acetylesterase [Mucilaginibacter terrae]MDT3404519.1 lysophospholipase L1-like esterase [Mucilaginibacter terrae]
MRTNLTLLSVLFLALCAWISPPQKTTVYMIGDSTMSIKEKRYYPETGWGMPFANYFDSTIVIENRAKNGKSTKTFINGGWASVNEGMKAGDYLIIQFGHNDEVPTKKSATTESEFKKNLEMFVAAAKGKKVTPVLITPVARRKFDSTGHILQTHEVYAQIVRNVAKDTKVVLIDLDIQSQQMFQQLGDEKSKMLLNYLEPGQNPNYPKGKEDDTHFSELGARRVAEIVLKNIIELKLGLAEHIVKPKS